MLAKVDTNDSENNPYAPPATNDTADAKLSLSADDRYRVVGKNLVCRVGCEQFPNVCWLTGSTEGLFRVHCKKVRYLSSAARNWLGGIALVLVVGIQIGTEWLNLSTMTMAASVLVFVIFGITIEHCIGESLTIVVGESAVARRTRRLARTVPFCVAGLLLLAFVSIVTVDVVNPTLIIWFIPVVFVAMLIAYLWLSPRNFNLQVNEYDEGTVIISGLTQEFLNTLSSRDRSWMPVD